MLTFIFNGNIHTIFALGTPYTGGVFRVKLLLAKDFPATPPKAFFVTRIFHPNVAANGEICVNTLKRDWKPDLGIKHILLVSVSFVLAFRSLSVCVCVYAFNNNIRQGGQGQ